MRKSILLMLGVLSLFSCTQDENVFLVNESDEAKVQELTATEAQSKFARILSKAVSGSVEVRRFLKDEALKQFDNDYDVFYPYVKDKVVQGSQTFRDILLSYCDSDKELEQVEQAQPLLTILVPDLTLFWEFDASKWDVYDEEVAVLCREDKDNTLYENGEAIGQMETGDIPAFPCLVVKTNERLRVNTSVTRADGGVSYEFVSDAFDGSKRAPQTRHWDADIDLEPQEDLDAYVSGSSLSPSIIQAYREFKDVFNACHRDYIYYGMTKDKKEGTLNRRIREKIWRFCVSPLAYQTISNSNDTEDPGLQNTTQEKRQLTNEEILQRIWTDGNFEFQFKVYVGKEGVETSADGGPYFTVKPQDLYSLGKVHLHHKNGTAFRHQKNFYTVDVDNLCAKWVYTDNLISGTKTNCVFSQPWNLYDTSSIFYIWVEEVDPSGSITTTQTVENKYEVKSSFTTTTGDPEKGQVKVEYGTTHTSAVTQTVQKTVNIGSDQLGRLNLSFDDPVIIGEKSGTYRLYSPSTGTVQVTFLPLDIYTEW